MGSKILSEQKMWPFFSTSFDLEPKAKSITFPDPDFNNFDSDRMEKSFDENKG